MSELYRELSYRADEIARNAENRARLAQVFTSAYTIGVGTFYIKKRIDFGLTFLERPTMSFGCAVDVDALAELLGVSPSEQDDVPMPLVTGMVTEWDQDERGFYVGAWVAIRVYFPVNPVSSNPV